MNTRQVIQVIMSQVIYFLLSQVVSQEIFDLSRLE